MPTFSIRFAASRSVVAAAKARADILGMDLTTVANALLAACAAGTLKIPAGTEDVIPGIKVFPPSVTLTMTYDVRRDYQVLVPDCKRVSYAEDVYWKDVSDKKAPYPRRKSGRPYGPIPRSLGWYELHLHDGQLDRAVNTAGLSISGTLSALFALYAQKRADVTYAAAPAVPPSPIKTRAEERALQRKSRDAWGAYRKSLTTEQREEIWRRDDAPWITKDVLRRMDLDSRRSLSRQWRDTPNEGSTSQFPKRNGK